MTQIELSKAVDRINQAKQRTQIRRHLAWMQHHWASATCAALWRDRQLAAWINKEPVR